MGIARVASRAQLGLAAPRVDVEVHLGSGLPTFSIVGLAGHRGEREQRSRSRGPAQLRVRVSRRAHHRQSVAGGSAQGRLPLRPAHRARHPAGLRRSSKCPTNRGELASSTASSGSPVNCKPIKGVLLAAAHAAREGRSVVVPAANLGEARLAAPAAARGAATLLDVCGLFAARARRGRRMLRAPLHAVARGTRPAPDPGSRRRARPGGGQTRAARGAPRAGTASC